MTDNPLISVITPSYNRAHVLGRAIRSLRRQTLDSYEHIIVDDGSSDDTKKVVGAFGDDRIRYVALPERQGANAARNAGLDMARAPLVTFLDSDDEFRAHRLRSTVDLFAHHPEIGLLSSSFVTEKGGVVLKSVNTDAVLAPDAFERALISHAIFIAGSAITARRAVIRDAGDFDPTLWRMQDRELLLRMARGGGVLLSSDVDWIKHESPDSISRPIGGYVQAFSELANRHPHLREKYPRIVAYIVARHILRALLRRRFGLALSEYRANRGNPALHFPPAGLAVGYVEGKKLRRQIREEVRQAPAPATRPSPTAGDVSGVIQAC